MLLGRRDGQEALRGCAGSGEAARPGPWGTLSSRESPLLVPYQRVCVHLWVASAGRVASRAWGSQPFPCPLLPCGSDSQPDCCKTVRVSGARLGLRGVELSLVLFNVDGAASIRPLCPLVIQGTGERQLRVPQPCSWGLSPAGRVGLCREWVLRWWGWAEGRVLTHMVVVRCSPWSPR